MNDSIEDEMNEMEFYYRAMFKFLEVEYGLAKSDDIGALLGAMQIMRKGGTADPAYWHEWSRAI